jgi:polar amino acid transport system substrate-binding protein
MKKWLCFFILFLFTSKLLFSFSDDIRRIQQKGTIVVGMVKGDGFPFFMKSNSDLVGLDIDLANAIAKELSVTLTLQNIYQHYDDVVTAVANEEVDIGISFLTRTLERSKQVYFTNSYMRPHLGLLINRAQLSKIPDVGSLIDRLNKQTLKIGVLARSARVTEGKRIFNAELIKEYETIVKSIDEMKSGEIIACLVDEFDLDQFILVEPEESLRVKTVLIEDFREEIAMALGPSYAHLRFWLNEFLETQPTYRVIELFNKYEHLIKREP